MKTKCLLPEPLAMMESTRAIGYSTETAVADILDNSLAAGAENIDIFYMPASNEQNAYVAIIDDGVGMNGDEIDTAMRYGGRSPLENREKNDLGRFGLGLKTASLSQCDKLTVVSKQGDKLEARCWDMELIRENKTWVVMVLNSRDIKKIPLLEELKEKSSGTMVLWENLDRMQQGENIRNVFNSRMDVVRSHISLVFHRFLSGSDGQKKVHINMNGVPVEPSDPFLMKKSQQLIPSYEVSSKIRVMPIQLPHVSQMTKKDHKLLGITEDLAKNQGFYIYRNRRLIIWGTWFRRMKKSPLSQLARICIDIPSDFDSEWVLDVKKSTATPPPFIISALEELIRNVAEKSKRTWTYRGRKETSDKIQHIWNRRKTRDGGFFYEVNEEHPLVTRFLEKHPGCDHDLKQLLLLTGEMLPLNQLMLDLNNDNVEIENETKITEKQVRSMLDSFVQNLPAGVVTGALKSLKDVEPFHSYLNVLKEYIGDN